MFVHGVRGFKRCLAQQFTRVRFRASLRLTLARRVMDYHNGETSACWTPDGPGKTRGSGRNPLKFRPPREGVLVGLAVCGDLTKPPVKSLAASEFAANPGSESQSGTIQIDGHIRSISRRST
jgi:hypothetical protein